MKKKLILQAACLVTIIISFLLLNFSIYLFFTSRFGNNYGDAASKKMIDLERYLPFTEENALPKVETSIKLTGDLPVLDGAAALVPVYASVIENLYPEGSVTFDGDRFSDDTETGENFSASSVMQYKNTVRGFDALVNGETDLFFSAAPSEEQRRYAYEKGVELVYMPIGLEAFVFFVNAKNSVCDLSVDEVRSIYAGEIKNWKEVGGRNRGINPVTRIEGSGSQTMMETFMGDKEIAGKSFSAIGGASIGYSFSYYLSSMVHNDKVKMLSLNGVYPSEENIQNGSYPVTTAFYVIYRKDNDNENIEKVIEFLYSAEGKEMISKCGYTPFEE